MLSKIKKELLFSGVLRNGNEKVRKNILEDNRKAAIFWAVIQLIFWSFSLIMSRIDPEYTDWVKKWKFSDDVLKYAYDKCIEAIGKYQIKYVNSILERWNRSGIKTLEQAKKDAEQHAQKAKKSSSQNSQSSQQSSSGSGLLSSFDMSDLDGLSMF